MFDVLHFYCASYTMKFCNKPKIEKKEKEILNKSNLLNALKMIKKELNKDLMLKVNF